MVLKISFLINFLLKILKIVQICDPLDSFLFIFLKIVSCATNIFFFLMFVRPIWCPEGLVPRPSVHDLQTHKCYTLLASLGKNKGLVPRGSFVAPLHDSPLFLCVGHTTNSSSNCLVPRQSLLLLVVFPPPRHTFSVLKSVLSVLTDLILRSVRPL